jgi:hypothetical protein
MGSIIGHKQTVCLLCMKERLWEAGKCKCKDKVCNKYVQNNIKGGEKDLWVEKEFNYKIIKP